jgi:DNA-binding XRE family transcriptional regulator
MTQEELATAIGMLRTSIVNIEAGRQKPPLHVLYQICSQLGAEPSAMMPALSEVTDVQVTVAGDVQELPPQAGSIFKKLSNS